MQLLFNQPRLGFKAGQVGEVKNIGVAKTLISFGVAIEYKEEKSDEVVPEKNIRKPSASGKRKPAKRPSKRSSE